MNDFLDSVQFRMIPKEMIPQDSVAQKTLKLRAVPLFLHQFVVTEIRKRADRRLTKIGGIENIGFLVWG